MLADKIEMLSWWTFTVRFLTDLQTATARLIPRRVARQDVFEEGGMGSHPWAYPQWGLLSKAGIPKPSYRAFELLNKAGPLRFPVTISGQPAAGSVSVLATAEVNTAACTRLLSLPGLRCSHSTALCPRR